MDTAVSTAVTTGITQGATAVTDLITSNLPIVIGVALSWVGFGFAKRVVKSLAH